MNQSKILSINLLVIVFAGCVFGQINKKGNPRFTSVYTDLTKDCKPSINKQEERETQLRGEHIPLKCKVVGNYYLFINYSVTASILFINNNRDDSRIELATQNLDFNMKKDKMLEWRLADGKPFAVILPVSIYKFPSNIPSGATPFDAKYKIGESLIVRGLLGYEQIEYNIDAHQANAVELARQSAEEAFLQR